MAIYSIPYARDAVYPEYRTALPIWTHPSVAYHYPDWNLIRDVIRGEKEVKQARRLYLPAPESFDENDYEAYLQRATFYNFTGRTVQALNGTLFRRAHRLEGLSDALTKGLKTIGRRKESFEALARETGREYLQLGRIGLLVDLSPAPTNEPKPYVALYRAENILDWDTEFDPIQGREVLTFVALREWVKRKKVGVAQVYRARYRILRMEGGR